MATEPPNRDPLSGIYGPMLFPRTIRASANVPVPPDVKDLDSIHNFMKSLELRSPDKLMNEAKKIMDGKAELLESKLTRFSENVHINHAVAAKAKDGPQERRQGLGLARKRVPFSLRTNISRSSVNLVPTLDIDNLQDPDKFFDAYEKAENAKKEIKKQLGGNMDSIKDYKPSNYARRCRREGILGKSYNCKHRYSSEPSENDMLILSLPTEEDSAMLSPQMVDQDATIAPKDKSPEKSVHPDPIPETDSEEVELSASTKKMKNEVFSNLEVLSCDNEDLEGDGALNLLQELLKVKPLDRDSLYTTELPGVGIGRTSTFTVTERNVGNASISSVTECSQQQHKSVPVIGNILKLLIQKSVDQEANPLNSSPTPSRSPFASLPSLKKKNLQTYPVRDPFSPTDEDFSECQNTLPTQAKNKLLGEVELVKDLGLSNEMESCMEFDDREPVASDRDAQEETENADDLSEQFVVESATLKDRGVDREPNEESEGIQTEMDIGNSSHFVLENEARGEKSGRKETDAGQQLEELLKVKPLDRNSLYPTELSSVGRTSTFTVTECNVGNTSISSVAEYSQQQHKSVPVIGNILKLLNRKSVDQEANPLNSPPTPSRSPFASVSSLQKKNLQTYPVRDPFSPTDEDLPECQNTSPTQANKLLDEVELVKDLGLSNEMESCTMEFDDREPVASDTDAQEETENADDLSEQFVVESAILKDRGADREPNEESEGIQTEMDIGEGNSSHFVLENEARGEKSGRKEADAEQQLEVDIPKPPRKRETAGGKRSRTAHPMRKSLADAGTSYETGVRRSKRIKMRPLEYWKGERFLYGRVNDSFKLIGVKYISPGKDAGKLKVKPYIQEDSSEYKNILELAALH